MNLLHKLLGWILLEEKKEEKPKKYRIGKKEILAILIFSPIFIWTFFLVVYIVAIGTTLLQNSWLILPFFLFFANPLMMVAWYFLLVLAQLFIIAKIALRIIRSN